MLCKAGQWDEPDSKVTGKRIEGASGIVHAARSVHRGLMADRRAL